MSTTKTPVSSKIDPRASLMFVLDQNIEMADETIVAFSEKIKENAVYALEWSEKVFRAAAIKELSVQVRNAVNANIPLADIAADLMKDILRDASVPACSSQADNLMKLYIRSARTGMYENVASAAKREA